MPDFASSPDKAASHAVICGAGSAGLTWQRASELLPMRVLPVPDEPTVHAMAAALVAEVSELPGPRLLTGYALGAMVALEVQKLVPVGGLVLISAGFGIKVGRSLLDWVAANPPDLFEKMAKASLADPDNREEAALAVRDFEARGQPVVLRHLQALGAYRPQPPSTKPPTLVIWGEKDRSVPLADHIELALTYGGALAPIAGVAHKPYLERPEETVSWMRWAASLAAAAAGDRRATGHHPAGTPRP
jgi:pimeloyl-ACP methyl ester carboxylesterase